jgi:hypothetical protein
MLHQIPAQSFHSSLCRSHNFFRMRSYAKCARKSFRFRSYKNTGGWGPTSFAFLSAPDIQMRRLHRESIYGTCIRSDASTGRFDALLPPLCFHILTNPFSHNPFIFTSIQIPRGCASKASNFHPCEHATPLFAVTSLQPQRFHAMAHLQDGISPRPAWSRRVRGFRCG